MNCAVRLVLMLILVVLLNPVFGQSKRQKRQKNKADFGVSEGKLERAEDVAFSEPFAAKIKNDRRPLMKPNYGRKGKRPDGLHGRANKKKKKAKKEKKSSEGEK